MSKHSLFLRWSLFATVLAVLSYMAIRIGAIGWIHSSDRTFVSFSICIIGYLATLHLGFQFWRADGIAKGNKDRIDRGAAGLRRGRYLSAVCRDLGLLGTIIGFVLILKSFAEFDASHAEQLSALIKSIGANLGTAFVTTLAGLVASMVIDGQCHVLEEHLRKVADDE